MIEEFADEPRQGRSAHNEFQLWRRKHAAGSFLAFKSKSKANLHINFGCRHPGDANWTVEDGGGASLTRQRKVCSDDAVELMAWAESHGVVWRWCADCDNNSSKPSPQRSSAKVQPIPEAKAEPAPDYSGMQLRVLEGIAREVTVLSRSRSRDLRMHALERASGVCEACCVDFSLLLSGLGARALQVHHRHQLALQDEPVFSRLADLAVVCANCHAMIHSDPMNAVPVEQLRERLFAESALTALNRSRHAGPRSVSSPNPETQHGKLR